MRKQRGAGYSVECRLILSFVCTKKNASCKPNGCVGWLWAVHIKAGCSWFAPGMQQKSAASEVIDGFLYLGDIFDAGQGDELQALGIAHILNVQDVAKHIPLSDLGTTQLNGGIFEECFKFIDEAKQQEGRVLALCIRDQPVSHHYYWLYHAAQAR